MGNRRDDTKLSMRAEQVPKPRTHVERTRNVRLSCVLFLTVTMADPFLRLVMGSTGVAVNFTEKAV